MAVIDAGFCKNPLQLNGVLDAARWGGAGSMSVPGLGVVLVQNDDQFLYIGLDVVQDTGNDPGTGDYFWVSFDVNKSMSITPHVDVNYGLYMNQPNHLGRQFYLGPNTWTSITSSPKKGGAACHIGFGASLNSGVDHRMWEIRIPLSDIGGTMNASPAYVLMGLRVHSHTPAITIDVPPGFSANFAALTKVILAPDPAVLLGQILQSNPQIAAAIQWQNTPADPSNMNAPPTAANLVSYPNWSSQQKADLLSAFEVHLHWVQNGAPSQPPTCDGLTDAPVNLDTDLNNDNLVVGEDVSLDYMWRLYVNHVAFNLVHMAQGAQTGGFSLAGLSTDQLRWLLSSTTMAWYLAGAAGDRFGMGISFNYAPSLRANNLPTTSFAPARWVYSWLRDNQLIGQTRYDTICRVLDWMRHNMEHFLGLSTFGNCQGIWQYRGFPPLSRIIAGTTDPNDPAAGQQHYTMGCHGSVGFLNAMLRVLNIPVLPVWVCGHELAYFPTEGLYLDHGDDPYNQNVKNSTQPISLILIDEATYAVRFSSDPTVNVTTDPGCSNIGLSAANFPQ